MSKFHRSTRSQPGHEPTPAERIRELDEISRMEPEANVLRVMDTLRHDTQLYNSWGIQTRASRKKIEAEKENRVAATPAQPKNKAK